MALTLQYFVEIVLPMATIKLAHCILTHCYLIIIDGVLFIFSSDGHCVLVLFSPQGNSTFVETPPANGTASLPSAVTPVASSHAGSGKRRFEERTAAFDKRLRVSVRQTESAYRYRDIVVKKQDGFTHILFSTKSTENNSLNPEVSKILLVLGSHEQTWWWYNNVAAEPM